MHIIYGSASLASNGIINSALQSSAIERNIELRSMSVMAELLPHK
jgi:hypothetical protein